DSASINTTAVTHFVSLPLSDWHSASVVEPIVDSNLYKEPRAVAKSVALSAASHAANNESSSINQNGQSQQHQQTSMSHSDWIREIVAVTHCLMRLQKLPQVSRYFLFFFA
ncbi:unnamed protein product, partial [Trichobilharzia regenti]